jgi:hypothetical protein
MKSASAFALRASAFALRATADKSADKSAFRLRYPDVAPLIRATLEHVAVDRYLSALVTVPDQVGDKLLRGHSAEKRKIWIPACAGMSGTWSVVPD